MSEVGTAGRRVGPTWVVGWARSETEAARQDAKARECHGKSERLGQAQGGVCSQKRAGEFQNWHVGAGQDEQGVSSRHVLGWDDTTWIVDMEGPEVQRGQGWAVDVE